MATLDERLERMRRDAETSGTLRPAQEAAQQRHSRTVDGRLENMRRDAERQAAFQNSVNSIRRDQVQGWRRTQQLRQQQAVASIRHDQEQGWKRTMQMRAQAEQAPEAQTQRAFAGFGAAVGGQIGQLDAFAKQHQELEDDAKQKRAAANAASMMQGMTDEQMAEADAKQARADAAELLLNNHSPEAQVGTTAQRHAMIGLTKYAPLSKRDDFTALSRYSPEQTEDGAWSSLNYELVNQNRDALSEVLDRQEQEGTLTSSLDAQGNLTVLSLMTDQERGIYNYLYHTEGQEAADAYFEWLLPQLNAEQRQSYNDWADQFTDGVGGDVAASLMSVAMSPFRGASYLRQARDLLQTGRIDQNSIGNFASYAPTELRKNVSEDIQTAITDNLVVQFGEEEGRRLGEAWGKWGTFGYQTVMSMADFFLNAALTGNLGGGGGKAAEWFSLTLMGTGAAADATIEAKERGVSDAWAFGLGTVAGLAEIVTEKVSLEKLLDKSALGKEGFRRYVLKNVLAEGSEEGASDLINWYADGLYEAITHTGLSEWETMIREIQAENPGMSRETAIGIAFGRRCEELGLDLAGGMLSGGVMAGISGGLDYTYGTAEIGKAYNTDPDTVRALLDKGLASPEGSRSRALAEKYSAKLDSGRGLSNWQVGRQVRANEADIAAGRLTLPYLEDGEADGRAAVTPQTEMRAAEVPVAGPLKSGNAAPEGTAGVWAPPPSIEIDEDPMTRWNELSGGTDAERYSFRDVPVPTYEQLIEKPDIPVVDIRRERSGSFAAERDAFLNSERAQQLYAAPILNRDTGESMFITPGTIKHTFSNLGWEQIELAEHLPEIIENAVLTHAEPSRKAPRDHTTGVYTLFGAAQTAEGVQPVKLTVKEYDIEGQPLPQNIKDYLGSGIQPETYASVYDGKVLVLEGIEKEGPSSSAGSAAAIMPTTEVYPSGPSSEGPSSFIAPATAGNAADMRPSGPSIISVKDLLALVKGDAVKYIPQEPPHQSPAATASPQGKANIQNGGLSNGTEQRTGGSEPAVLERNDGRGGNDAATGSAVDSGRDGGRVSGERSGGQAGRLDGGAELRRLAGQRQTAIDRRNHAKDLRLEPVSSRQLGMASGTEDLSVRVMPRSAWDEEMESTAQRIREQTGMETVYVLGKLSFRRSDGDTGLARAANTGRRIILQCDNNTDSVTRLGAHEIYHSLSEHAPGQNEELMERVRARYGEAQLQRVLDTYVSKLYGVYDVMEGMTEDEYESAMAKIIDELLADAYAGINAFGANAARFQEAVREGVNEYWGITDENAAATERITGPPERYSYAGRNANGADTNAELFSEEDIDAVQRIGRKNVSELSSDELRSIEAFARKAWGDMGTKSPFFRAWFGDWRSHDQQTVTTVEPDTRTPFKAGKAINADTGRVISWGNTLKTETITHLRSGGVAAEMLGSIEDLVKNAVLLDTSISGPDSKSKLPGTALMHSFYVLARDGENVSLLKLYAEEAVSKAGEDFTRAYDLKDIKTVATSTNGVLSQTGGLTDADIATIQTVADLFAAVKDYDSSFQPQEASAVVNEDGTPRIVYHGTNAEFNTFESEDGTYWFSESEDYAEAMMEERGGSRIVPAYLSIRNPLYAMIPPGQFSDPGAEAPLIRQARMTGHDGLVIQNDTDNELEADTFYVAFSPDQIKSATENVGTFDRGTADIRYSVDDVERIPQSSAEYAQMKRRNAQTRAENSQNRKKKPVTESRPILAKQDLKRNLLGLFSIPEGRRAEIGQIIDRYADYIWRKGELSQRDMDAFFDRMYSEGVMTVPADEYARAGRQAVTGGRIYVPARLRAEFGEDWQDFRRRAFGAGVLLTSNSADSAADQWNMELAESFPNLFDAGDLDERGILETIVNMAEDGKDQKLSLAEYAAMLSGQEGVSEDEYLDQLERQMDWALRTYAEKAKLEVRLRDRTGIKIAEEREKAEQRSAKERAAEAQRRAKDRDRRRELAQRQSEHRALQELQQKTLKQLQWLSRNRQRAPAELQAAWDEVLGDIDIYAVSAANEMHWSGRHQATWRDLADMYQAAKQNDPNFLPSKELERIVSRLDKQHIADMDPAALADLYKAAVGLRTEFYNRNNVINDEEHRAFEELYEGVRDEVETASGGYDDRLGGKLFNDLQLTPMNAIARMGGWNRDGQLYSVARMLEQGERDMRRYTVDAKAELAPFLEEHSDWVKRADGQGRDAIWYEIEVPELLELGMGDKPIFGKTVKVWMTPTQKVHMYLESKSYDNLRHMAGGRTFANKELYSEGKRAEAFAQGTTIRLAPETVKKLVSDLTPEEQELARVLEHYYNESSRAEINRVSNALYGYDKAIGSNYAPIFTNSNYVKSEPGVFDLTAEGVGNMKARQFSKNPSYQISAFDAFERSVDQTSRFVGMAIPARNVSTLMNWREANNSMRDVLTHKWGKEGAALIDDLLTELQGGKEIRTPKLDSFVNKALSKYIQAVFGFNPSIVFKQFASYPLAAAYLGYKNMPVWVPGAAQVDTELIRKYSGELAYRTMGYATPETALLKDNPGKMQEKGILNFVFGGGSITWMDGFTVRCLWTWAENKVKNETNLQPGTQEQIDAGTDPYYRAVAREFEEAVSRSQPMYDVMHRSAVMRDGGGLGRAFTLFKTVPQQEYNMLREAFGELHHAKENGSKEDIKAARKKAGRAVSGILIGNLMIGVITFLNAMLKNKGKKYRDDEDELTAESFLEQFGKQYFSDSAGLVIFGDTLSDILSNVIAGDKWYDLDAPGIEQVNEIIEGGLNAANTVKTLVADSIEVLRDGGDWAQYMADHSDVYISAVDELATLLGKYGAGLPTENVKAYLLGALSWLSPEIKTAYEDALSKADKNGLKGLTGPALEMRIEHLMGEHGIQISDESAEALAELYAAGFKTAIPTDAPSSVTVDGENRKLSLTQQQTWDKIWSGTVGESLDELVRSEAFLAADAETQAKMLDRLYDYATEKAKEALFDDYEPKSSTEKTNAMIAAGVAPAEWAAWKETVSDEKRDEQIEQTLSSGLSDESLLAAIGSLIGTDMETESGNQTQWAKLNAAIDDGVSVEDAVHMMQNGELDTYTKWRSSDAKAAGISATVYIDFRETLNVTQADKDATGKTISGSKKEKVMRYINSLPLTGGQKDALYYDAGYTESTIDDAPWHSGQVQGLSLPSLGGEDETSGGLPDSGGREELPGLSLPRLGE